MSLHHFNSIVSSISFTADYPIPGTRFIDLSRAFGSPALGSLCKTVAESLCIEQGQVILGVPTRGSLFAIALANASNTQAVFLSKAGGPSTPLPGGSETLCKSGTAYSGKGETEFTLRKEDKNVLLNADIVWVTDDVCESGTTMRIIRDALRFMGCRNVQCLALLSFPALREEVYSIIDYEDEQCFPGKRIFGSDPSFLFTLRGGAYDAGCTLNYGPPSMNSHLIRSDGTVADVQWNVFPGGGQPNIHFQVPLPHEDVFFIYDASLNSTTQDGLVHALARSCQEEMTVFVPYLPQGTMERVDEEGTLATAQTTLHSLCAAMPGGGKVTLQVVDIHSTAARFFTTDRVRYEPVSRLITLVPTHKKDIIIAFPDDGAAKRFRHMFPRHTLLVFSKIRDGNERKITLSDKVGPLEIQDATAIYIVDDLTRTGGTLLNTAKILKQMGAKRVVAAFVHADLDVGKTISFAQNALLDAIVCTDSIPRKARALKLAAPDKVTVMPLIFPAKNAKPVILASSSQVKLTAVWNARSYRYVWTGPVPSGIPEQPVGVEQTTQGARNRYEWVNHLFPESAATIIALESGMNEENCDISVAYPQEVVITGPQVAPDMVAEAVSLGTTVGKLYQARYSLPNESAWIGFMDDGDTRREELLEWALGRI